MLVVHIQGQTTQACGLSLKGGRSPSTFAAPEGGRERRLVAKARAAAKASKADHQSTHANLCSGDARAQRRARSRLSATEMAAPSRVAADVTTRIRIKHNIIMHQLGSFGPHVRSDCSVCTAVIRM